MSGFILGEKSKQLQHFTPEGDRIPTTFIKTSPCFLVSIKLEETHGYCSIKLGFGNKKNIQKPVLGELKKAGIKVPLHFLHEFRLSASQLESLKLTVGQEIKPADFFDSNSFSTHSSSHPFSFINSTWCCSRTN